MKPFTQQETLQFLEDLSPDQWDRGCIHTVRGRMTLRDYFNLLAGHDKIHLEQVKRADRPTLNESIKGQRETTIP